MSEWKVGRAGMLYRVLSTGFSRRVDDEGPPEGGTHNADVIVSHIRLPFDGEVPDYVHYHKVEFQVIYCLKGRIKVVYEDQGPPFWLEPGDCVLQPPEIRHQVLVCEANSEVIEVTMPAEHETWADHDLELPTSELKPDRTWSGQRFLKQIGPTSGDAESNFRENILSLRKNMPKDERIGSMIQTIVPQIQAYLASF